MAVEHATTDSGNADFEAHVRNYAGFIRLFKWGAILAFISAMLIIFIISK